MRIFRPSLPQLNALMQTPFEQWPSHGVRIRAISANAHGHVNSGILQDGRHFFKRWDYNPAACPQHTNPHYEWS